MLCFVDCVAWQGREEGKKRLLLDTTVPFLSLFQRDQLSPLLLLPFSSISLCKHYILHALFLLYFTFIYTIFVPLSALLKGPLLSMSLQNPRINK